MSAKSMGVEALELSRRSLAYMNASFGGRK